MSVFSWNYVGIKSFLEKEPNKKKYQHLAN